MLMPNFAIFLLTTSIYAAVQLDDFDEVARQYAENKAREYGRTLKWYDIYGKQKHLMERPQYHRYKITAWSDNVKYGVVEKTVEKPGYVYTQWFHNSQSVPIVTEFSREVQLKNSYSWSVSNSVKMYTEIKASAGIPGVLGVNTFFNSSIDLQSTESQTTVQTEIYSVKNIITIPPNKSVKAEFIVTEKDVQVPWEADVEITGWIAMWFDPKYNNHWLWFHPITSLANAKFKYSRNGGLLYHSKGTFRGLRGVDTVLKTYEYELMGSAFAYYKALKPLKVTEYKPNMMKL
uniref:Cytotoxin n=1 Tax=Strigamia maritima TaxID=126957 RepID=T1IT04_STRMM